MENDFKKNVLKMIFYLFVNNILHYFVFQSTLIWHHQTI